MSQTPGSDNPNDAAATSDLDAAVARSRAIGRDGGLDDGAAFDGVQRPYDDDLGVGRVEPSHESFEPTVQPPEHDPSLAPRTDATVATEAAGAADTTGAADATAPADAAGAANAAGAAGTTGAADTAGAADAAGTAGTAGTAGAADTTRAADTMSAADPTGAADTGGRYRDAGEPRGDLGASRTDARDAARSGAGERDGARAAGDAHESVTPAGRGERAEPAVSDDDALAMEDPAAGRGADRPGTDVPAAEGVVPRGDAGRPIDDEDAAERDAGRLVAEDDVAHPADATEARRDDDAAAPRASTKTIEVDRRTGDRNDDAHTFAPLGLSDEEPGGAPLPPKPRSNRGFAFAMALIGTLVAAALFLVAFAGLRAVYTEHTDIVASMLEFLPTAPFYVPASLVGLFFVLWAVVSNRAGHWSYAIASLFAAAIGYVGYHLGVALQLSLNTAGLTLVDPLATITDQAHLPAGLVAALIAALVVTWFGTIIAARGRRLYARNRMAKRRYERELEAAAARGDDARHADHADRVDDADRRADRDLDDADRRADRRADRDRDLDGRADREAGR